MKRTADSPEYGVPLVAAAAATTAGSAATEGRSRGFGGCSVATAVGSGENRKLDAGLLAGALGAGYFLLLIDDNLLEAGFALFTKVFVDGHGGFPLVLRSFAPIIAGVGYDFQE